MADHPLRPATDRRLGRPLPHQLANRTSAAPIAQGPFESPAFLFRAYAVLANLSTSYPPRQGTFRCITHPFATRHQAEARAAVRLACVRHAASVQSEPGSNSSVQSLCAAEAARSFERSLTLRKLTDPSRRTDQTCFAVRALITFEATNPEGSGVRHQAPTLIGCLFVKEPRARALLFCVAASSAAEKRDYEEHSTFRQQFFSLRRR